MILLQHGSSIVAGRPTILGRTFQQGSTTTVYYKQQSAANMFHSCSAQATIGHKHYPLMFGSQLKTNCHTSTADLFCAHLASLKVKTRSSRKLRFGVSSLCCFCFLEPLKWAALSDLERGSSDVNVIQTR